MICQNCKSSIPNDSKFCPDCGTPVIRIEELRTIAKEITIRYKKGYDFYVNDGVLPRFLYNITATDCEKIIEKQNHIIAKHLEIEAKERQKTEEAKQNEAIRKEASGLTISYAKGYRYYVNNGTIPSYVHNLSIDACKKIISFKSDIIRKHQEIENEESSIRIKYPKVGESTSSLEWNFDFKFALVTFIMSFIIGMFILDSSKSAFVFSLVMGCGAGIAESFFEHLNNKK